MPGDIEDIGIGPSPENGGRFLQVKAPCRVSSNKKAVPVIMKFLSYGRQMALQRESFPFQTLVAQDKNDFAPGFPTRTSRI